MKNVNATILISINGEAKTSIHQKNKIICCTGVEKKTSYKNAQLTCRNIYFISFTYNYCQPIKIVCIERNCVPKYLFCIMFYWRNIVKSNNAPTDPNYIQATLQQTVMWNTGREGALEYKLFFYLNIKDVLFIHLLINFGYFSNIDG